MGADTQVIAVGDRRTEGRQSLSPHPLIPLVKGGSWGIKPLPPELLVECAPSAENREAMNRHLWEHSTVFT